MKGQAVLLGPFFVLKAVLHAVFYEFNNLILLAKKPGSFCLLFFLIYLDEGVFWKFLVDVARLKCDFRRVLLKVF